MADASEGQALVAARVLVAEMFGAMRRTDLAALVAAGEGDDFPEVVTAAALLEQYTTGAAGQVDALRHYADPDFWDEATPGGALAVHDRGEMARNVLRGRPAFFHRD